MMVRMKTTGTFSTILSDTRNNFLLRIVITGNEMNAIEANITHQADPSKESWGKRVPGSLKPIQVQ